MKIEIYKLGDGWHWELRDEYGHPICKSEPRTGQKYYTKKQSCINSARRFKKLLKQDYCTEIVIPTSR